MPIDLDHLRRHYASLSNQGLLAIDRSELVDAAQKCYDDEIARRKLARAESKDDAYDDQEPDSGADFETSLEDEDESPGWLEDAACATSFLGMPGSYAAEEAATARDALKAAGIPCSIVVRDVAPDASSPSTVPEYQIMVPGALSLHATAILDRDVFNPRIEEEWRTHFQELSDDQLRALHPEVFCAGLLDRVQRLENVYHDEMQRRGLTS